MADACYGVTNFEPEARVGRYGPHLVAFVLSSLGVVAAFFRLRPCYTVYLALTWILIFCNNFPLSSLRFVLTQFPLFMLMADWGRRPWLNYGITFASLIFYTVYCLHFSRGGWAQ